MVKPRVILTAISLGLLAACSVGDHSGAIPSSLLTSQGTYGNPTETPAQYRIPQSNIRTSGIPGESGYSAVSSALSGSGGGGGGAGGGGGGGAGGGR
jgi:hypothetical protein